MSQVEIEKSVNRAVKKRRPGVKKKLAGITASVGIAVNYVLSGGAFYDIDKTNKASAQVGPQRELSAGGDVYFSKAPSPENRKIVFFVHPSPLNESPPNESPPAHTITAANPSSLSDSSPTTEATPISTSEPTVDYVQLNKVVLEMEKHKNVFSQADINAAEEYYPIYKVLAEKTGIPWTNFLEVHKYESNYGENEKARDGSTYPLVGITQINVKYYPEKYILESPKALNVEFLVNYPQWYPDDYIYLSATARILGGNYRKYINHKYSPKEALIMANGNYAGAGPGYVRAERALYELKLLPGT
jgi:hypothetical protein